MALRNKITIPESPEVNTSSTEVETEVLEVTETEEMEVPEEKVTPKPSSAQAPPPAVKTQAAAPPPAVAPAEGEAAPSIMSLKNAIDPAEVGTVFKRLTGTNGALYIENKLSLGEFCDIQVLSHSERWFVVPDHSGDDPKGKRYCRASYDGHHIWDKDKGKFITIEEYGNSIKSVYPKGVRVGKYHDVFAIPFNSNKNADKLIELGIIQVSISPTSVNEFMAYARSTGLRIRRGLFPATHQNCLRIVADPRQNDQGKNYVAMLFQSSPPDALKDYYPIYE